MECSYDHKNNEAANLIYLSTMSRVMPKPHIFVAEYTYGIDTIHIIEWIIIAINISLAVSYNKNINFVFRIRYRFTFYIYIYIYNIICFNVMPIYVLGLLCTDNANLFLQHTHHFLGCSRKAHMSSVAKIIQTVNVRT